MTFRDEWSKRTEEVQEILYRYLPEETGYQKTLLQAMNYSMQAGGKRLRPLLMQETYRLFGGAGRIVEPFMAAMIFRLWIMMNTAEEERPPILYMEKQWRFWQEMAF